MFGRNRSAEDKAASAELLELRVAASTIGGLMVRKDPLRFTAPGQEDVPVYGATVTVDKGEAAKRVTLTRVALTGVFALLLKKDATALFVTIEGADGSAMILQCAARKELAARKFAMLVARKVPPAEPLT
ncbi:hypothetical protein ABZY06_33760 [Streptomyces sp. NPDC006540]|uniref:hypothetical protein n=1 Tax=Streptomyces sp. NPDC006540 TaxID=3155353 RepID=UPI0033B26643